MTFTLPLPTRINATYKTGHGNFYKSQEAKDWEEEALVALIQSKVRTTHSMIYTPIYVGIEMFIKRDCDIDSRTKILLDFMQNKIYRNDSQIQHLNIKKYVSKENPRVEVTITEL